MGDALFQNEARGDRVGARNILNAQVAGVIRDFIATLYGSNLTDQHYVGAINSGLRFAGPPRQFGVQCLARARCTPAPRHRRQQRACEPGLRAARRTRVVGIGDSLFRCMC